MVEQIYFDIAKQIENDFYDTQSKRILTSISKKDISGLDSSRDSVVDRFRAEISRYKDYSGNPLSDSEKDFVLSIIEQDIWGYGLIDDLIHEKDISDIKLYSPDRVRIKKLGKRFSAGVRFSDTRQYINYINKVLERNRVNLGTANAIRTFTDSTQKDAILRITCLSGLLVDGGLPVMAIRKIPKDKYTLDDLNKAGMFDHYKSVRSIDHGKIPSYIKDGNGRLNSLIYNMINSRGILFTGKGASGKTTLMNAFISKIPYDESVMICQENSELFDRVHPDLFSAHILTNTGDSKVSYSLGDLTECALLMDLDRVIVGEVKSGAEASALSKASMTGHKCWTSVHGESCLMAYDKMADYVAQATNYSLAECKKQLTGFEYVIHLNNFKINEIIKINSYDALNDKLIYERVYPFGE